MRRDNYPWEREAAIYTRIMERGADGKKKD
jgi:hypothetical protein